MPREQDRAGVLAFYKARNFAPIWIASGKPAPRAEQAKAFLKGVAADGLDPADYATPGFTDPAKLAADELALTNSVITFARHASIGRVAFTRVSGAVYYDQKAPNPADVLGKLAESTDVRATLDAFNPQAPAYKALKAQLADARSGKSAAKAAAPEPAKTPAKDSKSKKGQHEAKATDEKPKAPGADTIIANMERWRWMPHDLGATYVMVNIPDYTLKVVKDGKTVWSTKIVVGKPGDHATPLLTETMKFITVNPTWNVPPSIIRNEYLPALARDPGALSRIGLQVGHNKDGSIRIFQPPGERNALGRIRFNFPNRFLVYQHDTPDKKLFALASRAYSHGCMRVQNPDEYAEVLLGRFAAGGEIHRRAHQGDVRLERAHYQLQASDPGLHHLSDRVRRRRRQGAGPGRHLRSRPRHPQHPARRSPQLGYPDRAELQLKQQAGVIVSGRRRRPRRATAAAESPAIPPVPVIRPGIRTKFRRNCGALIRGRIAAGSGNARSVRLMENNGRRRKTAAKCFMNGDLRQNG